jgi:membrane protease YdiL (CAAX protease family)
VGPLLAGALAGVVVTVVCALAGVGWARSVGAGLLLGPLPGLAVVQGRLLRRLDEEIERIPAYVGSTVFLVLLGAVCYLVGTRGGGARAIGLLPLPLGVVLGWAALLVLLALAIMIVLRQVGAALGLREDRALRQLLPVTRGEKLAFLGVSACAGLGEEIAYRGFAFFTLVPAVGTGGALLATSAAFGVLHGYQGGLGMLRAGTLGALLAGSVLVTGSLWPAIVAHAALDVVAGVVVGDRLMVPEPESGV